MNTSYKENTPDNFWQIRWLDRYMEGHNGFIAGGCFKNILSGERVKDIDIFFESNAGKLQIVKDGTATDYSEEKANLSSSSAGVVYRPKAANHAHRRMPSEK